jgi:hypothetical protein
MTFIKRVGITSVFQLFFLCFLHAQSPFYSYTSSCVNAADAISKLQLDKAKIILTIERKKTPHNLALDYLDDCLDYYILITNSDKNLLNVLEKQKSIRIANMRKISATNPDAAYAEAEISQHWAILKLMQGDYISGSLDLRTAYQLHKKNYSLYPHLYATYKSLGFIKALLGTLPENYHWILSIVGLKGDYQEGINLIETCLNQYTLDDNKILEKQQAAFYYTLLQFYFGNKQIAWSFCKEHTQNYQQNLLSCYLRSFIASHTANTDEAIAIITKRPKSSEYAKFEELDFVYGYAKLNKLELNADIYFKKYVTFGKNVSLKKDAYKRLSWIKLLNEDTMHYHIYRKLAYKQVDGKDDEDIMVENNLKSGIYEHTEILKARLQFDGGYYTTAENIIKNIPLPSIINQTLKCEYHYRYGRILQEQAKYSKAIDHFTNAVKIGETQQSYFAPFSALQLGNIYHKMGLNQTAIFYFEKAIAYKNYESKAYITQKAKQALSEIK